MNDPYFNAQYDLIRVALSLAANQFTHPDVETPESMEMDIVVEDALIDAARKFVEAADNR